MKNWYQYEQIQNDKVRILRAFGLSPEIDIPSEINGMPVTEIGAYCFSQTNRIDACKVFSEEFGSNRTTEELLRLCEQEKICELSGKFIQRVVLPDSVVALGNFSFYQCSCLEELEVGKQLLEIGSDAFMNCRMLSSIVVRGSITQPNGLKQILAQRDLETQVTFLTEKKTEAVILYPEYSESYDEIGPAHIFTLNIEGDGFRARQCFKDGIVDLVQYDDFFEQALVREDEKVLCNIALMRLAYPVNLLPERKKMYELYIADHIEALGKMLVREKNSKMLQFLMQQEYMKKKDCFICIREATALNWAEGVRQLLEYEKTSAKNTKTDEYAFDDF